MERKEKVEGWSKRIWARRRRIDEEEVDGDEYMQENSQEKNTDVMGCKREV